ncbi:hypothetical protein TREMEDRAFT_67599 [Tremella mesenterica DSM 1558]|uniref:uncharacterized protein n=1 Tax=Tremella mesenterica (strain ATCC 24925 / CBS 8224 / DSM 1558 / NBRC 9311 / NRRL Y-6157 / RJB 2259-6 / UBC 559-6) TaxID=578456 RepID=UPI0003F49928|nr:uncharacterized protein TREMEDRAFT_67599 [Tremella mesenterica DSM 1558]EIW71156.1 hypothetical protein TREMEDRAFT_67599 [Tremella mesenterica DSM 1558]
MPSALFTASQSRWALHILVGVLSAVAIASSAPPSAGGAEMYSGQAGDIRGLTVILGSCGLGGVSILRAANVLLPKPWRIYVDRLEFTIVAMLWICWTSATMAFSAFTLEKGVCSFEISEVFLPNCPLLTFDLALLHLLSSTTLSLLLVILSTALSPNYYLQYSNMDPSEEIATKDVIESDVFVMWEMALASPPQSPKLGSAKLKDPSTPAMSYGTQSPTTPLAQRLPQPTNPYSPSAESDINVPKKRDKFAEGRVWNYVPLLICSIVVVGCAGFVMAYGQSDPKSIFDRQDRALEVACAGFLFLLWPFAAIIFTLLPSVPNRACANPAASAAPTIDPVGQLEAQMTCFLSTTVITLAWFASWLFFARLLGLVFPMPDMDRLPVLQSHSNSNVPEARPLLRNTPEARPTPEHPKMGWGRIVAGEAFELGEAEDD